MENELYYKVDLALKVLSTPAVDKELRQAAEKVLKGFLEAGAVNG